MERTGKSQRHTGEYSWRKKGTCTSAPSSTMHSVNTKRGITTFVEWLSSDGSYQARVPQLTFSRSGSRNCLYVLRRYLICYFDNTSDPVLKSLTVALFFCGHSIVESYDECDDSSFLAHRVHRRTERRGAGTFLSS